MVIELVGAGIVSYTVTYYLIPLFMRIAYRCNVVDRPDGQIKIHQKVTPYLGGVAVYIGFLVALGLFFPFTHTFFQFLIGITILLYAGLIDDIEPLSPLQKSFAQLLAVGCFFKAGLYLKTDFLSNISTFLLSALWMMLMINAFNLIDIMDGLATTTAICAATSFCAIALYAQNWQSALLLIALIGALGAFLCFNKPPAQLYLGDAGSLWLGGFFATMPFLFDWGELTLYGLCIPIIILAIPLLELAGLIVIRTYKGTPFYRASPDHFALYLRHKGVPVAWVLVYIGGASLVLGLVSCGFASNFLSVKHVLMLGFLFVTSWLYCIYS